MPSTFTALGFEKQAAGEHNNTWGSVYLNDTIQRTDYAIGGYYAVAITGSTSLTTSNSSALQADNTGRQALLKFTGTLAANATITVPSVGMKWLIWNATNKVLTFTTGAGATVTIDAGDKTIVWCDGAACYTVEFGGLSLKDYIAAVTASAGAVPGVTGNAGKYLYTDGVSAFWRQPATADLSDYNTAILGVQVALAVAL